MHTHIDRSIDYVVKADQEDREKDKVLQVGFYDNLIFQNQMSSTTMGDYKTSLDELTTRIDNVTSLVEDMVAGPQPHNETPPTVPSVFGRLVDPNGEQQVQMPQPHDSHVTQVHG